MLRGSPSKLLRVLVSGSILGTCVPVPTRAQTVPPADASRPDTTASVGHTPPDAAATIRQGREFIKSGDYDRAIDVLKVAVAQSRNRLDLLNEAYLSIISTHIFLSNDNRYKPQGKETSLLHYDEAKRLIAECLRIPELRHTRPEPASEYPPEMITAFAEVRSQMFGSFRLADLHPPAAVALLGSDTLRSLPGDSARGDTDLAVGRHLLTLRAPGYVTLTDQLVIAPGLTLAKSYRLTKRRGKLWYASRGGVALGLVGGLVAVLARGGDGDGTSTRNPLPGPPAPPAHR